MYWTEQVLGMVCDRKNCTADCGERARQTFRARTRELAMRNAREAGWQISNGGEDLCPACRRAAEQMAEAGA